jgi:2,3-bisphosphoglycerate-independent phosphoglycerate mutase
MSVLFLFVDGIGLGEQSSDNPFAVHHWYGFSSITDGAHILASSEVILTDNLVFKGIDATLGIDGLPQSGTGQATLFSGVNASKLIGKHFGPYPHTGIKHLLTEHSLFHFVNEMGKKPYFINAFPQVFFDRAHVRNRWSCCTLMTKSVGQKLNSVDEVLSEKAITAEIIQDYWRQHLNLQIPPLTISQAASRVAAVSSEYDVTLMEYYLTDKAGHEQDMDAAYRAIERLDTFLNEYIKVKPNHQTLILTSDHGNIEDLSTKTHTLNPVPLIAVGPKAGFFTNVESIQDITPVILKCIK